VEKTIIVKNPESEWKNEDKSDMAEQRVIDIYNFNKTVLQICSPF